jgi:protein SCO1
LLPSTGGASTNKEVVGGAAGQRGGPLSSLVSPSRHLVNVVMSNVAVFNKVSLRWIAAAVLAIAAVAGTAAALTLHQASQVKAALQLPHVGGHFELSTPDGRSVTDATFRGKWLIIYFGYTSCADVCPGTLMSMAQAMKKLGPLADRIQPLFITLDPARDTPQIIGEYVKDFDPRFVGLVGSPEQVADVAGEFHVYYRVRQLGQGEYVLDHSSFIYVMDPNGTFAGMLSGDLPGHEVAEHLAPFVN